MNKILHKKETPDRVKQKITRIRRWAKLRRIGSSALCIGIPLTLGLGTIGLLVQASRATAPDRTRCLDSINELRAAVAQANELGENAADELEFMVMKQNFVPDFENDSDSKRVKEIMETRAQLNTRVREKWEAWKSCSEGMQK